MDAIGWLCLSVLAALVLAANLWSIRETRRRAALARAWAAAVGLAEVTPKAPPPGMPPQVRRNASLPAFRAEIAGRPLAVVPTRTQPRFGYLWALCTTAPGAAPVFVASRLGFTLWSLAGGHVSKWVRAEVEDKAFSEKFLVQLPAGATAAASLPAEVRRLLLEAHPHLWCWNVRPDGVAVLWTREAYGADPAGVLGPALELLRRLVG